jgi:hypothetical protein
LQLCSFAVMQFGRSFGVSVTIHHSPFPFTI